MKSDIAWEIWWGERNFQHGHVEAEGGAGRPEGKVQVDALDAGAGFADRHVGAVDDEWDRREPLAEPDAHLRAAGP